MFSKKIFSERLVNLRKAKGISKQTLANDLQLSYFSIAKMENAERACSVEVLYSLADYFNVSIDYLVGRTDNPQS